MGLLINWIVAALAIIVTAYLLPGVTVSGFVAALVVAVVLGVLNALVKPLLLVLTLPINVLTLGLFTFVINGLLIWLSAKIVPGFTVSGFGVSILFAIVLTIVMYVLHVLF